MPRRNPYGWTFCPIASLYSVLGPVEPASGHAKLLVYKKPAYFAAFLAAGFLAAGFLAAGLVAAFFVVFFAAVAPGGSAGLPAVAALFSGSVPSSMAGSRRVGDRR